MPGSKRRALKQLLSPSHSPSQSNPPAPVQSPPPMSIESSTSLSSLPSADNGGMTSSTSMSSNPNNYLSDEALEQDLALEEMASRQNSIGSGHHREEDGVPDLSSLNLGNGGTNGHRSSFSSLPPPPPPKQAAAPTQVTADQLAYGKEDSGGFGFKGKKKSSKQRFAERQARRQEALLHSAPPNDPAWNAQLEKERQEEIKVITDACAAMGAELHEIPPDGHCMFNAIGDQLAQLGLVSADEASNPRHTRKMAAQYMLAHPDDFMPFLPSITGEDSAGATDDGMMTPEQFQKYCSLVAETGEWGGEPEIQALSRAFKIPIHVFQRGPPTVVSHGGPDDTFGGGLTPQQSIQQGDRVVRISYHKRMYGLGEHYNSLRKAVK